MRFYQCKRTEWILDGYFTVDFSNNWITIEYNILTLKRIELNTFFFGVKDVLVHDTLYVKSCRLQTSSFFVSVYLDFFFILKNQILETDFLTFANYCEYGVFMKTYPYFYKTLYGHGVIITIKRFRSYAFLMQFYTELSRTICPVFQLSRKIKI